jgi:hypothetical protein
MPLFINLTFASIFMLAAAPPNPDPSLGSFYHGLTQPKTGFPCCSIADCREANYRIEKDHFEVYLDQKTFPTAPDAWVPVPNETVLPHQANPTGEGIVCWTPYRGILCFLEANGT